MMRSYWIWFSFLAIAWGFAFVQLSSGTAEMPWRMSVSALFFALYFMFPLFRNQTTVLTMILILAAVLAIVALWPVSGGALNFYPLLVFSLLAGEAVFRLPAPQATVVGVILWLGGMAPYFWGYPAVSPIFIGLYGLLHAAAFYMFRKTWHKEEESTARNEALLSEYRKMKRRIASDEQTARQEERAQVGRDIHDSVGHKLTALLMQLEVFRLQAGDGMESRVQELKELAKESLEETRSAVKAMKRQESGGLPAILSLIRKLEAESFFRVNFSVRHGALSAPLNNAQSIAVYRAVQEALTNIMKHSNARNADIMFEAPGGGVFRFEVINAMKENKPFREGFGLQSMRERIETVGGRLEVIPYEDRFVVRGTLSMIPKGADEP